MWQSVVIPQLKRIPPCGEPAPTSSELAGIWVAIGERHCLYQLTLKAEGSGTAKTICNLFGAPDTSEYQIREWTTRDYRFDVRLLPLAKAQDSLRFYGISCVDCLFLNHQIKTGEDHDSKLKFYRLSAVQNAVDGGM